MEYVHNPSIFKTCFMTFINPVILINAILLVIGIIIYELIFISTIRFSPELGVEDLLTICIIIIVCIWTIIITMIIAFIFSKNEKLLKLMPELNYKFTLGKPIVAEFLPKDVVDNKCEIPLFNNVGLDYEAIEDFSRYLVKVKIIEHGFNDLVKGKKKLNPYLWKAIFYFKQKPTTGKLEVKFK